MPSPNVATILRDHVSLSTFISTGMCPSSRRAASCAPFCAISSAIGLPAGRHPPTPRPLRSGSRFVHRPACSRPVRAPALATDGDRSSSRPSSPPEHLAARDEPDPWVTPQLAGADGVLRSHRGDVVLLECARTPVPGLPAGPFDERDHRRQQRRQADLETCFAWHCSISLQVFESA